MLVGRAWLGLASLALIERSVVASSPTMAPSFAWSAHSSLSKTMSGRLRAATSAPSPWPSSALYRSPTRCLVQLWSRQPSDHTPLGTTSPNPTLDGTRPPTKSHAWVKERYWPTRGRRRWVFGLRDGTALARHAATTINEHVKVKGDVSFFDGNVVYWASRLGRHPELPKSKAELLKRQHGRCARCGLFFTDMHEVLESDHCQPRSLGGKDGIQNRDLLHRHCHDQKTAADGSNHRRTQGVPVTRAKTSAAEEPGEANVSRPVL